MQAYILGIDIGTGSTKGVALDLNGKVISVSQHHYPIYQPEQGFSEQDPELIWQAFIKCIKDIVINLDGKSCIISLSSAMHSVIPVDDKGMPFSGMMTWADVRSEDIALKLKASAQGEHIYRTTGTPIHPMSPLCKLIWLKENNGELFKKTAKFISIKEFIWYKLFKHFQVDYAIASATGLFDIEKLCWSEAACNLVGVKTAQLSEIVNTDYIRRDIDIVVADLLLIHPDTIFVIGASDGCCANLGSHVVKAGTAALTIGTSGAVRITGAVPVFNYDAMIFNYRIDAKTFVSGGAVNNGGIAVDWLLKKFLNKKEINTEDYISLFNAIEGISPGSDGLLFLPYLYGERAPIWDAKSSGAFLNIRPEHGQAHFLRAALEGICYALNDVIKSLEKSSVNIEQINVSGGFITSTTWLQLLADITGKRLLVLQVEDASAIGAAYLAMQVLFPENSKQQPDYNNSIIIEPNAQNYKQYANTFPLFKKMYLDMKDSMHLLYQLKY